MPSHEDFKKAQVNLKRFKNAVDLVFTHTCPRSIKLQLPLSLHLRNMAEKLGYLDPTEEMLEKFLEQLKFGKWYFGHFHLDYEVDERFTSIFDKILPVT